MAAPWSHPSSSPAQPLAPHDKQQPESLSQLFWAFSRLALMGFGGVLPVAQRELVQHKRWLDAAEFAELLSVGQVLPGPNVVNLALMFGDRFFGWRGALVALAGMLLFPLMLVLSLAAAYHGLADLAPVRGALRGMGAVAAGLVLAMGLKLLPALRSNPLDWYWWLPLGSAAAVAVAGLRWPLVGVLLVLGPLSCGLAWWRLRRRQGLTPPHQTEAHQTATDQTVTPEDRP